MTIEHSEREGGAMVMLKRLLYEESGQGMVEYGLILALIAVAVIAALSPLGQAIKAYFEHITTELGTPPT